VLQCTQVNTEAVLAEQTETLTVRLPTHVKARLESLAKSTDRTKSWLAAEAIRSFVEVQEWQVGEITRGVADADAGDFATSAEVEAVFGKWAEARVDPDTDD